ncbi:MAG: ABC transporter substrate-binding protein [Pseudomonadota bacterium]
MTRTSRALAGALAGAALAAAAAPQALAEDAVKIGYVTTLTTPAAVIGEDMKTAVELALKHMDGQMGGAPVEVLFEDDGFKPEIGKQKADKLVKQDDVDIVAGFIWSHVLLASSKTVLDSGKILISSNAGPSRLAGKGCHPNFFNVSWQNDQTPMALGEVLNKNGVGSVYVMAPNYAAGKNMVSGVERTYAGEIKGKDLTKWGKDAQLDFSAELAKAKASGAEALWAFYPGKAGPAFMKQFQDAGLGESMKLFTTFTVDGLSLPRLQQAKLEGVIGSQFTQSWAPDIDTPENARFVAEFLAETGRDPSFYAAQAYDTMFFIKAAVEAAGGVGDVDKLREAMRAVTYLPTRGTVAVGANHFPVQDFYLREVVVGEDGRWTSKIVDKVYTAHVDPYAGECAF